MLLLPPNTNGPRPPGRLRIAQVAPLYESVPPAMYGGTERVVHYLTEELVAAGHQVTLFASGDSRTSATLVPCCSGALRLASCADATPSHVLMLERVLALADRFDIVHFHTEPYHFPLLRRLDIPSITTWHGRLDLAHQREFLGEFPEVPLVSISDDQRRPVPHAAWQATVYHGLPLDQFPFRARPGSYLAFVGRISPEKRPDLAVEIAEKAGMELRIAAKISETDRRYFEERIKPLLSRPHVRFLGEKDHAGKAELMAGAAALLMPLDWPEPFGLVMIEAMACGTPVIAFRRGSVPEIVDEGATGFIVDDADRAAAAVSRAARLDRKEVRRRCEVRFSARRMAEDYLRVYRRRIGAMDGDGLRPPLRAGPADRPPAQGIGHGRHSGG